MKRKFLSVLMAMSLVVGVLPMQADAAPLHRPWPPRPEHTHTEVIDEAVAPTCTETGLTEGKHCSVCNDVLVAQDVVDALGHTEVIDAAVAPTCTETGLTEGKHCSVCDEVLVAQEEVAAAHTWDEGTVTKEPTCTEAGEKTFQCTAEKTDWRWVWTPVGWRLYPVTVKCNEKTTAPIDALGHTDGDCVVDRKSIVEATCTKEGSYDEVTYCAVCDAEIKRVPVTVPAFGHTEVIDAAVAPTCTETGLTEGKHCSKCNEVLVAQDVVDALGHTDAIDAAVAPTCTETGLTEGKHCSVCNEVLTAQEVVDALGHTAGDVVIENKLEDGSYEEVVYCTVCKTELSRVKVPAVAEEEVEVETEEEVEVETEEESAVPETGDVANIGLYIVCLAMAAVVAVVARKRVR